MLLAVKSILSNLHFEHGCLGIPGTKVHTCSWSLFAAKLLALILHSAHCFPPDNRETLLHFGTGICTVRYRRAFFFLIVGFLPVSLLVRLKLAEGWHHSHPSCVDWALPSLLASCVKHRPFHLNVLYCGTSGNTTSELVIKYSLFCKTFCWLVQLFYKTLTPKA